MSDVEDLRVRLQTLEQEVRALRTRLRPVGPLTEKQKAMLTFIADEVDARGRPPSRSEIQHHFGYRSPNSGEEHLRALVRKGAIELTPNTARGIRILAGVRS
jgi:SOS-response transcriptional repressor LexA